MTIRIPTAKTAAICSTRNRKRILAEKERMNKAALEKILPYEMETILIKLGNHISVGRNSFQYAPQAELTKELRARLVEEISRRFTERGYEVKRDTYDYLTISW